LVFGVWCLVFGVWSLEFGVWSLGFGIWSLGFGVWGFWVLGFGVWVWCRGLAKMAREVGSILPPGADLLALDGWLPCSLTSHSPACVFWVCMMTFLPLQGLNVGNQRGRASRNSAAAADSNRMLSPTADSRECVGAVGARVHQVGAPRGGSCSGGDGPAVVGGARGWCGLEGSVHCESPVPSFIRPPSFCGTGCGRWLDDASLAVALPCCCSLSGKLDQITDTFLHLYWHMLMWNIFGDV
jgi:hypothetical protein